MDTTDPTSGFLPDASGSVTTDSFTLLHPTEPSASSSSSAAAVARSQSPAKRLKSEEPPNSTPVPVPSTLEETPEPMDEDTEPPRPEIEREESVDMLDGSTSPTEVLSDVSGMFTTSSVAPSTTTATTASAQLSSTTATSVSSASRPSIEEQVQMVYQAKLSPSMKEGAVWYIISGRWLNKFLAQSPSSEVVLSKEDAETELGPIDNSDLVDTSQLQEQPKKKSDDRVDTDEISISEDLIPIKPGSCGDDFEILPENVWDSLVSWYGLAKDSPIIKRKVVNTSEAGEQENLQFEYYPPTFTVYKLRNPVVETTTESLAIDKAQSPHKVIAAKAEGFQKFLRKVKKLAGVEPGRKVRLWRILGSATEDEAKSTPKGVKKSGKEKGTGMFGQLMIDFGGFLDLKLGSERELVDLKDTSNDENYNGSLRIATAGLGAGGTIVVEEQSSDGEWISEKTTKQGVRSGQKVTLPHGKSTTVISKKKTPSRSSSPSASSGNSTPKGGIMTRGRRDGRPQGKCGLSNLGNTCYMNSALQCLRSVKELSRYFISDEYEKELNPTNPLAHHGKVARAYATLLKNIFSPTCPASFSPREFKNTIGRFGPSFQGYGQQDSQEFLAFLLDGLHEDLNRIQRKPYIEKPESTDEMVGNNEAIAQLAAAHWDIYKKRNDSAIADLFGGLYQSTLVCPTCAKVSITFDPFMDLTLPLPVENVWSKEVYFIPKDDSNGKMIKIPVEMDKNGSIKALKEYVGNKMGVDSRMIMASEVYKTRFFKHYDDNSTVSDQIQHNDDAFLYELDDIPTNFPGPKNKKPKKTTYHGSNYRFDDDEEDQVPWDSPESERLLIPVFHKVFKENKFNRSPNPEGFGVPFFIVVNREEAKSLDTIMGKILEKYQVLTTRNLYEGVSQIEEEEEDEEQDEGVEVAEHLETPKEAGGEEEETDGFVDVSMKDASSIVESDTTDDVEKRPARRANKRGLPPGLDDLFAVKITRKKGNEGGLVTGWQGLDAVFDIRDRLNSNPPPSPPPRKQTLFPSVGNSGRVSPSSQISDDLETFEDAPEPQEHMMQDNSDDEEGGTRASFDSSFAGPAFSSGGFMPVPANRFYNNSSSNSSKKTLKTPSGSQSPVAIDESPLVRWGEGLICEWTELGHDSIFGGKNEDDFRGRQAWLEAPVYDDPELIVRRRRREDRKKKGIHLEDCLDEFAKDEILSEEDPWYCPRCKVHRRASKKFELWKCPDILVIHLKRFSSSRNFRDKIDVLIDCPVEGLDLSNRVGLKENGQSLIYDLLAVDNHYGGLGGGHYTAYAKNWVDDKWYYCDDSNVREVFESDKVITPAAYLLFYRRRSSKPLGGPEYERILTAAEGTPEDSTEETAGSSRDSSTARAGGGGPSDDSSISITVNGEPRRSSGGGVSGLSTVYGGEAVGNANLWGKGPSMATVVDDDQPPIYSAEDDESAVVAPLVDTVLHTPVGFAFGTRAEPKNEPLDMSGSDADGEIGGGIIIPVTEEDTELAEIRIDDEDTITPAADNEEIGGTVL